MRVYVDFNTTTVYDAFVLGFEGILERTLAHHRLILPAHHNERVRDNVDYYRSKTYESQLSSILYKAFGVFNTLMGSQLVCINTEHTTKIIDGPVERLTNLALSDAIREIVNFEEQQTIEYLLFDEDTLEKLYNELEEFRLQLISVIKDEIEDALKEAILRVKK